MDEQTQDFIQLINDADALALALNISESSPSLQTQIIGEWSSLLFKRLLLRVPTEQTTKVQRMILENNEAGTDIKVLIEILSTHIPDFEKTLKEEIAKAVAEFRISKK